MVVNTLLYSYAARILKAITFVNVTVLRACVTAFHVCCGKMFSNLQMFTLLTRSEKPDVNIYWIIDYVWNSN